MKVPTISVIIPTYYRPDMLNIALQSLLNQTFQDFEAIIVIDGGVENYKIEDLKTNPKVKVIVNEHNKGVSESRNIAIKQALGQYIAFLDDDDEYTPDFLFKTYKCLNKSADEVGLSWCNVKHAYHLRESDIVSTSYKYTKYNNNHKNKVKLFEDFMSIGLGFGVVIKAECLSKVGRFNSQLKLADDTDLFLRIMMSGFIPVVVPKAYVIVNHHNQNRLTGNSYNNQRIQESKWLLNEYKQFLEEYVTLKIDLEKHIERLKATYLKALDYKLCSAG